MAKKTVAKVNKSGAIREYLEKHPDSKPLEVVEVLGKKGIEVTANVVATVKSNEKKKGTTKRVGKKAGTTSLQTALQAERLSLTARIAAIDTLLA